MSSGKSSSPRYVEYTTVDSFPSDIVASKELQAIVVEPIQKCIYESPNDGCCEARGGTLAFVMGGAKVDWP